MNRYERGRTVPTLKTTERLLAACRTKLRPSDLLGVKVDLGTVEMMRPDVREKVLSEARPLVGRDHDPLAA